MKRHAFKKNICMTEIFPVRIKQNLSFLQRFFFSLHPVVIVQRKHPHIFCFDLLHLPVISLKCAAVQHFLQTSIDIVYGLRDPHLILFCQFTHLRLK